MDILRPKTMGNYIEEVMESAPSRKIGINNAVNLIYESLQTDKKAPEDFSIKELWDWFVRDESGNQITPEPGYIGQQLNESVDPSAFPVITRELISKKMIGAYTTAPGVADLLVEKFKSKLEVDTISGFTGTGNPKKLMPGQEYEHIALSDKFVNVGYTKYGRRIDLTEEAVLFDQTGKLLQAAQDIGEGAKYYKEFLILNGVQDIDSAVYRPNGVATQIYAGDTLITGNALANETDVDNAWDGLVDIAVGDDQNARKLMLQANLVCLIPSKLTSTGWKIFASQNLPVSTDRGDNPWGQTAQAQLNRRVKLLVSPLLDVNSKSTWYFGNFKKQFVWKETFPFSMVSIPGNPLKDIVRVFKTRFAGEVTAIDNKWVNKSTA